MNPKCLRCGQDGHFAQECKLPVLPDDRVLAVPLRGDDIYRIARRLAPKYVYGMTYVPEWIVKFTREIEARHGIVGKEGGNV